MQIEHLNNLYIYAELALYAALILILVCAAIAVKAWANLKNAEADSVAWHNEYNWADHRDALNRMNAKSGIDLAERTAICFELED